MPNILFASNSISHFPGSVIGNSAWMYDSARVPYGITTVPYLTHASPFFEATTTDELWVHFKVGNPTWYHINNEPVIELIDINGNRVLKLNQQNTSGEGWNIFPSIDGNTAIVKRRFVVPPSVMMTIDIKLKLTTVLAEIQVYVNEHLVINTNFAISSSIPAQGLLIGGNSNDGVNTYSEIIVADGDTRNARLDLLRPIAAGTHVDWVGPINYLSDDDPTTGMTTVAALQEQSTVLSAYTGASNISNIVQATTTIRGINSPTQLQHLLRLSAVDYFSSNFSIPFAKDTQITDWPVNPATSSPWVADDLANAEFGFKSIA